MKLSRIFALPHIADADMRGFDMAVDLKAGDVVPSAAIVKAYKKKFGIDVSRFFPSEEICFERIEPYGYFMLSPSLPGDADFYSGLMRQIHYDDGEKAEFLEARRYVGGDQRVLDIGCGPGRFSNYCDGSYKGIELNPQAVAEAQSEGRNVVLEQLEDQEAAAYDVVTMFQVLEHESDPTSFLAAAARCVAPGGVLLVSTPDMGGYMTASTNHVLNFPPHHLSWWTADSISALMAANGLGAPVVWKEPLQPLHYTDWLRSTLFPNGGEHFNFSLRASFLSALAKVGSFVAGPVLRRAPHITGQCVMVVGKKPLAV